MKERKAAAFVIEFLSQAQAKAYAIGKGDGIKESLSIIDALTKDRDEWQDKAEVACIRFAKSEIDRDAWRESSENSGRQLGDIEELVKEFPGGPLVERVRCATLWSRSPLHEAYDAANPPREGDEVVALVRGEVREERMAATGEVLIKRDIPGVPGGRGTYAHPSEIVAVRRKGKTDA